MDSQNANTISLEAQILEARQRAEQFTKSLQETRLKENSSLRALEEERKKWTQTFEEKSVMIDQLERELNFTVSALRSNCNHDKADVRIPDIQALSASAQLQQHQYVEPLPIPPMSTNDRFRAGSSSLANNNYHGPAQIIPPPSQREIDEMRSFIVRLQDELAQVNEKFNRLTLDDSQKRLKIQQLESDIRRLEEEKRLQQIAIRDYDGKLHFRLNQVLEYEQEKENSSKLETDLRLHIATLEARVDSFRTEQSVARAELQSCHDQMVEMETRVALSEDGNEAHRLLQLEKNAKMELQNRLDVQDRLYHSQIAAANELTERLQRRVEDIERKCGELKARADAAEKEAKHAKKEKKTIEKDLQKRLERNRETTNSVVHRIVAANSKLYSSAQSDVPSLPAYHMETGSPPLFETAHDIDAVSSTESDDDDRVPRPEFTIDPVLSNRALRTENKSIPASVAGENVSQSLPRNSVDVVDKHHDIQPGASGELFDTRLEVLRSRASQPGQSVGIDLSYEYLRNEIPAQFIVNDSKPEDEHAAVLREDLLQFHNDHSSGNDNPYQEFNGLTSQINDSDLDYEVDRAEPIKQQKIRTSRDSSVQTSEKSKKRKSSGRKKSTDVTSIQSKAKTRDDIAPKILKSVETLSKSKTRTAQKISGNLSTVNERTQSIPSKKQVAAVTVTPTEARNGNIGNRRIPGSLANTPEPIHHRITSQLVSNTVNIITKLSAGESPVQKADHGASSRVIKIPAVMTGGRIGSDMNDSVSLGSESRPNVTKTTNRVNSSASSARKRSGSTDARSSQGKPPLQSAQKTPIASAIRSVSGATRSPAVSASSEKSRLSISSGRIVRRTTTSGSVSNSHPRSSSAPPGSAGRRQSH